MYKPLLASFFAVLMGAMLASGTAFGQHCVGPGYGGHGGYGGYGGGYGGYGGYGGHYAPSYHQPAYDHCAPQPSYAEPQYNSGYYAQPQSYGSGYSKSYYNTTPPRQYYTNWEYDAARQCHYCFYHFLPSPSSTTYKWHEVIYYGNNYYYFNPEKRKFWGRAPAHQSETPTYSLLALGDRKEYLSMIPESAFPPPGPMPKIPESADNVAMILPQGGKSLTPDLLAQLTGDFRAQSRDAQGQPTQVDLTLEKEGVANWTLTKPGELPSKMRCRYHFDDRTLKMAGDYEKFSLQVLNASKDRIMLALKGKQFDFHRVR